MRSPTGSTPSTRRRQYPTGLNLVANTSVLPLGLRLCRHLALRSHCLLNVALTLSPVLSALSMFVLLRRFVDLDSRRVRGGLAYGFSPFVLATPDDAHLMLSMAVVPPLIILCLDELFLRQRRSAVWPGLALGSLVVLQFFIGTEVLLITAILGLILVALLLVYGSRTNRAGLETRSRHALVGLGVGAATAIVLLAYPLGFLLAGPAHLSGSIWPNGIAHGDATLKDLFVPDQHTVGPGISYLYNHLAGGYQGFIISPQYIGLGALAVLLGGLVVWRRDRRLWFFAALGVVSLLLALGAPKGWPTPWLAIEHLPLVENIIPVRFVLGAYLGGAVMLGLIVDHVYSTVRSREASRRSIPPGGAPAIPSGAGDRAATRWATAAALLVAAVALVPQAAYVAQSLPTTTKTVPVPTWFASDAPYLTGRQVLLVLPAPFSSKSSALTWQAVSGMPFSMVGVSGPAGARQLTGKDGRGASVVSTMSFAAIADLRSVESESSVLALRQALHDWGVTMVVIPDQPGLTYFDHIVSVTFAAAMVTAATGERPVRRAGAWVWTGVGRVTAGPSPTGAQLAACTRGLPTAGTTAVVAATRCISGSSS